MIKTLLFVIGFIAFVSLVAVCAFLSKKRTSSNAEYNKLKKNIIILICCAVCSFIFIIFVPGSFHQVEAGTYAVVKELGKIKDVRTPGTYFDFYLTKTYQVYDATVQQVKINTAAYSKDGQTMELEVYLQYQIQLDKLVVSDDDGNIIQTEGIAGKYITLESLQARIETQCIEKTKAVMSSAEAMQIIQQRATYSEQVSQTVRDAIGPDYYVNVQDVVLTNIDFTDEFEKSVEDKVVAEQQKQAAITKAEAELEVAKINANKKIAEAEGNAEAQLIEANAAAKAATAKIIELARSLNYEITETTDLEGITTYNIVIPDGKEDIFNKNVLSYLQYLAYLEKWNGELPQVVSGDDALSIIVPNNQ